MQGKFKNSYRMFLQAVLAYQQAGMEILEDYGVTMVSEWSYYVWVKSVEAYTPCHQETMAS